MDHHGAGVAVYGEHLAVLDPHGAVADAEHRWNAVFAGDDGTMRQDAAHVGDEADGLGEQLGPGRRGQRTHKDGTNLHLVELARAEDHARRGRHAPGAHWKPRMVSLASSFLICVSLNAMPSMLLASAGTVPGG